MNLSNRYAEEDAMRLMSYAAQWWHSVALSSLDSWRRGCSSASRMHTFRVPFVFARV